MRLPSCKPRTLSLLGILLASLCLAASPLPGITSGDLAVLVAGRLAGIPPGKSLDIASAREILTKSGLSIPQEEGTPVTEGALSELLMQLGITLQVAHPSSPVSVERVMAVVNVFSSTLASRAGGTPSPVSMAQNRRQDTSALRNEEPNPADVCLSLGITKDCRECCLTTIPGASNRTCGRLCGKQMHSSSIEPIP